MDELEAVRASQAGDGTAFSVLIDLYHKNIYRFVYQFLGAHQDADDICQETFLRAFNDIGKLRDGACFKGWLFMIALNLSRKRIKETGSERKLAARISGGAPKNLVEEKHYQPFEKLSGSEKAKIIHERLQKMPEHLRSVTMLILMEGLTQKEAAGIMYCSEATVSRHLHAARSWLRTKLQDLL